jgi:hypothetical protein
VRTARGLGLALAFVALVVNLPFLHHTWQQWRISNDGRAVVAEVTGADVLRADADPHYVLRFRLPEDVDPAQQTWPVEVDRDSYEAAEESGEVRVRVLPDQPSAHRVEGERTSDVGFVITAVVDLVLLGIALLMWRQRHSDRDPEGPADPEGAASA